jgi:hypothetical protein
LRYGSTRNTKWMILIFLRLKWVTLSGCIECLDAVNVTLIYKAEGVVLKELILGLKFTFHHWFAICWPRQNRKKFIFSSP